MSKRNKLQKFAELLSFPNVYENFEAKNPQLTGLNAMPVDMKGKWAKEHFGNDNPIVLELACGRGEYTLGMARMMPDKNFIGVDIKGARIWKGAGIALEEELNNAAFLRTRIEQIAHFFAAGEIDEIWITFPDPFLRKSKANRRLTSARFLGEYKKILKKDGLIHLKTDSPQLFEFTLETLETYEGAEILYQDADIYSRPLPIPELGLKTYYEGLHISGDDTIKYVRFRIV
ncbi:MAG: tRNA (guanosine(46)-N7)-methyltransferase TrmB [Bacteroidetes bacterium]|nr:MAG: tRNA (guanosine(46)-N7)-methyltransferase TrmB [Bacteroidota bacterium]